MDGIAVAASVTFGATATTPVTVQPGDYVVVDTGDPLPDGCDAVVMIEDVVFGEGDDIGSLGACPVVLHASIAPWGNVRQIGEDICAGEMLLTSNVRIEPAAMGAMLAAGIQQVPVIVRPRVGIIPTSDEVVAPSANPKPGDVMEFNSTIFLGMVRQWGAEPVAYPIVPDKPDLARAAVARAAAECDIVLLNAGSSAGRDDYSSRAVAEVGEVLYHGIAMKPGKPAILGCSDSAAIVGVPGYPVSGIIVVEQIVKPIVEMLLGCRAPEGETVRATLARPCMSSLKYEEFVRVRLGKVGDKLAAIAMTFTGCVLVSGMLGGTVRLMPFALATGIASGFFYATYSIFGRVALRRYKPLTITFYTFIAGAVASFFLSDYGNIATVVTADPPIILWIVGLGVVCSIAPYLLYTSGLEHLDPGLAAVFATVEPLVGGLLGILAYGESAGALKLAGMALILAAVVLVSLEPNNPETRPKTEDFR